MSTLKESSPPSEEESEMVVITEGKSSRPKTKPIEELINADKVVKKDRRSKTMPKPQAPFQAKSENYSRELYEPEHFGEMSPYRRKKRAPSEEKYEYVGEAMIRRKKEIPEEDEVSVPSDLQHDEEYALEKKKEAKKLKERKKNNNNFQKLRKGDNKTKTGKSKHLTQILGTIRYNPFAFGGSFGSMGGSVRGGALRAKALENPWRLTLVKGWYRLVKEKDLDKESISDEESEAPMQKVFKNFGKKKKRGTLSPDQRERIKNAVKRSQLGELSPEEMAAEEKKVLDENKNQNSCYKLFTDCFDSIQKMRDDRNGAGTQTPTGSNAKSKGANIRGECMICNRFVLKKDAYVKEDDEATGAKQFFHVDCTQCELTRKVVGVGRALELRAEGHPVLSDEAEAWIEETKVAQAKMNEETTQPSRPNEYLSLVPKGCSLYVPLKVTATDGVSSSAIVSICARYGVIISKKDKHVKDEGMHRYISSTLQPNILRARYNTDIKMVALGLPGTINFEVQGTSGLLKNPLSQNFDFHRDDESLHYELGQKVTGGFSVVYNLSKQNKKREFELQNLKADSLLFSGKLENNFGPYLAGHTIVSQEQDMRTTSNKVLMRGRYKHGILYDWLLELLYNEKSNLLTPVVLELTLRAPATKN